MPDSTDDTIYCQVQDDPFPKKGMGNPEWADMLLKVILDPKDMPFAARKQYLTRALDIACIHSNRPVDRFMDGLTTKLAEAIDRLGKLDPNFEQADFVKDCNQLLEQVRKLH